MPAFRPDVSAWLPPAFTAFCRKPQTDTPGQGNRCAARFFAEIRVFTRAALFKNVARITTLYSSKACAST